MLEFVAIDEPKVILLVIDKPADFVLLNAVKNLNSQLVNRIRVFVYYVASENIDPVGKQLACENLGSWFDVSSQVDLRYAHHYYSMLQPLTFSAKVTWSTIDVIKLVKQIWRLDFILCYICPKMARKLFLTVF